MNPRAPIVVLLGVAAVGWALVSTCGARERGEGSTTPRAAARARQDSSEPGPVESPFAVRDRARQQADGDATAEPEPEPEPAVAREPDPRRLDAPEEPPEPAIAPAPAPGFAAATAAAIEAAERAVADTRDEMKASCWDGRERGGVGDEGVTIGFSITFDARGQAIASSVQQDRDAWIDGLDRCLAPFAHAIEVPAPGESVSVDVELSLP
jgi:hypothetical protein